MMKKSLKFIWMFALMMLLAISPAGASTPSDYHVVVNGQEIVLKDPVQFENGRALVPYDSVFGLLNAKVSYDEEKNKVFVEDNYTTVELTLNDKKALVHKKYDFTGIPLEVTLEAVPKLYNKSVYIPLRFTAESLGASVDWDGKTHTASISTESDIIPVETPADYQVISEADIKNNQELITWYEENYQINGIHTIQSDNSTYILLSGGERGTGGYGLEVESATVVRPGSLYLTARVTKPDPDAIVTMAITYPHKLLKMENQLFETVNGEIRE